MKKVVNKTKKLSNKGKKGKVMHKMPKMKTEVKAKAKHKTKAKAKIRFRTKVMVLKPKVHKAVKKIAPKKKLALKEFSVKKEGTMFGPSDVKPYQPKKNEEYMSEKQLEHFRKVLLQWKSQLMEEVDRTMHHMKDGSANYPDPIDRASQEEEFNLELRARDRERKLLRKIDEALTRISDHDYGYCDDCGAEIGIRRLEARPTATQCIECKTIAEIREKQVGEGG